MSTVTVWYIQSNGEPECDEVRVSVNTAEGLVGVGSDGHQVEFVAARDTYFTDFNEFQRHQKRGVNAA